VDGISRDFAVQVVVTWYHLVLAVLIAAGAMWVAVNRAHRAALGSTKAQIELLEQQVGSYKEKLGGASPEQAAAKISELEKELGALREKKEKEDKPIQQGLPALTSSQISEWSSKLSKHRVKVLYLRSLEHSSDAFRESLCEVFRKAGWPPNTATGNVDPTARTTISSRGANGASDVVMELFKSMGTPVDHQEFPQIFPEHSALWITVGSKS
jgi:hypothetical protein